MFWSMFTGSILLGFAFTTIMLVITRLASQITIPFVDSSLFIAALLALIAGFLTLYNTLPSGSA